MVFTKNPRGRKKPFIISCRVDEETYRFIKSHGGGQRVLERLLEAVVGIEHEQRLREFKENIKEEKYTREDLEF